MKENLTVDLIDRLKPDPENHFIVWDKKTRGFGVRVNRDGTKTFVLFYRTRGTRQQRKANLGRVGDIKIEAARAKAKTWLGLVADGGDPAGEIYEERKMESLSELAQKFLEEYADKFKKPSSAHEDRLNWENRIKPALGTRKLTAITMKDVMKFHASLSATPIQANRCVALLSKMYSMAHKWGVVPQGYNPCVGVDRNKENKRRRYLTPDELARLGRSLEAAEKTDGPLAVNAFRLLLLTGARLGEIQRCRWEWVDWQGAKIDLPDSKTGQKTILLSAPALEVLSRMKDALPGSPWVVPGAKGQTFANLHQPWDRLRKAAGLADVRIHDLRHSNASIGVSLGLGLPIIGGLLGHTRAETTARYAHLANDPARAAAAAIGDAISEAMSARVEVIDATPAGDRRDSIGKAGA